MVKRERTKGRFGAIDEKITHEEYTLDWSQSKVDDTFLGGFVRLFYQWKDE